MDLAHLGATWVKVSRPCKEFSPLESNVAPTSFSDYEKIYEPFQLIRWQIQESVKTKHPRLHYESKIINRVEYMHAFEGGFSRDIKRGNFLMGLGRKANRVSIIDYGLAKLYGDLQTLKHISYRLGGRCSS
ncbi:hypothetical protein CRG98_038227 [Punica granatum]|uniref:Protein kinase domain-containing protein n=1 Tax=Punica granatum TaxID=22663 RepID=A0A2I0IBG9_PUNGR|nr:hypothetical protein CRG98_038227 [Punica granatum]